MKILIIGDQKNFDEFKLKFGSDHQYSFMEYISHPSMILEHDIIFDYIVDENPDHLELYATCHDNSTIFLNTVKVSLAELSFTQDQLKCRCYGFNGLPTFVNRDVLEMSIGPDGNESHLKRIMNELDVSYQLVGDRVGMVTPRVVFMIINEAFFTVQEGTATREDIDLGMKLGTNYPHGPFEWAHLIGLDHVYETLEAIYEDTKEERYKIAPLLKSEYLLR